MDKRLYFSSTLITHAVDLAELLNTTKEKVIEHFGQKICILAVKYKLIKNKTDLLKTVRDDLKTAIDFDRDAAKQRRPDFKTSCTKNCSHCCYQNVDIFEEEAEQYIELIKNGQWYNKSEFEKQKNLTPNDFHAVPQPCIFLKDGNCSIYENRPLSCQKYFVVNPPAQCKLKPYEDEMVIRPRFLNSEIVYSAISNVSTNKYKYNSLPYLINHLLGEKNETI